MTSTVPMNESLYDILGVGKDATEKEIQRAFRKLALKFHPDRNKEDPSASEKFKKVSEAYDILKDPEKRKAYDAGGMSGVYGTGYEGFADSEAAYAQFGDLFADLFGNRPRTRRAGPVAGQDLRFVLTVDFRSSAIGGKSSFEAPIPSVCGDCRGSGALGGGPSQVCEVCGGSGQIARQSAERGGYFTVASPCSACRGTGFKGESCRKCNGQGRIETTRTITVTIPAGIESGQVLRLRGQGQAGLRGGVQGDLLIEIKVAKDPVFQRDGRNIRSNIHVPLVTALLGGKIEVETVRGSVTMTVPAGTSSDQVLRIRGQGIQAKSTQGDHLVRIVVDVPKKAFTDEEQRQLRNQLGS